MKRKIRIFVVVVIFLCISITSMITLVLMKDQYLKEIESSLVTDCKLINSFMKELNYEGTVSTFDRYAHMFSEDIGARVTFINIEGTVIGDSEVKTSDISQMENHLYREEISEAYKGQIGKGIRKSSTIGIDYMYIALAFEIDDQVYGVTRVAYPLYQLKELNSQIVAAIFIASFVALLAAITISILYSGKVTKPISHLTEYAGKISQGHYEEKVYIKTGDEIEVLGNTLNKMAERLNISIEKLEENNSKLSSILFSMKEGIIAIDMDYNLILINHAAKELFHVDDQALGHHLLKVIRNNQLHLAFQEILQEQYIGEREIGYGEDETLKIHISYIQSEKDQRKIGVLGLVENITQIKKYENMRKDFVANVSHELKTPLTSISGFIETLQGGAAETPAVRNRFLDIISIETSRLKRLIGDLLILSDIESGRVVDTVEKVNVNQAIDDVLTLLYNEISRKNIRIKKNFPIENIIMENGNMDRFKQMLLNIIDNAIKYSYENGCVELSLIKDKKKFSIIVKDEGIGIAEENLPRLFERFYRVDVSRSKKVGGTGLGLAIVKHIVLLYNGEIKVESEEGKGSTFRIILPL